jgi:DNA-binding response OmpR family regulator
MSATEPVHLLAVEDEPDTLAALAATLEHAGYRVTTARDGVEAWQRLDAGGIAVDAVLLDRRMPRMDGMELLAHIKDDRRFVTLPVIFLTGMSSPDDVHAGMRAGAFYYLVKPCGRDTLLGVVESAILHRREQLVHIAELARQRETLALLERAVFTLRTIDEAQGLSALLSSLCPDPERVGVGLFELLVNAVEHGNLGISYAEKSVLVEAGRWRHEVEARLADERLGRRHATVEFERTTGELRFTITDEGDGFDWSRFDRFAPERAFDVNGRGIYMARMASFDRVDYHPPGNRVCAVLRLGAQPVTAVGAPAAT